MRNKLNIEKYITTISKLDPLRNSKFKYDSARWVKLEPDFKKLIIDFEDKKINREEVIKAYSEYYSGKGDPIRAFMLTMIWGFADTGYGTHRTNSYVSVPSNIALIKSAIDAVNQNNLKVAFNDLKKIKGLGVSYITKVLYFATRGANQSNYALIYDIRVASSLVQLTTPKEIFDIVSVSPSSKFKDYEKYNALIHNLAIKNKIDAESLEMFLFNQEF
ncbi:hypothetical protein [Polaribacter sp. Q13]|uniref:8-oxoguanine DNA glycosylase OGG fold protein n=1 Tax=Polaribacter sp. Q13 TaxID=2806551 RepID=UPI00193B50F7|nr:hypothetical protein [Polaribacter sp. Q13]QVY67109.1 hypothetical protein JOP69_07505 [Polaribacter sp. Q13]